MIHDGYKNNLVSSITKTVYELEQLKHCLELEGSNCKVKWVNVINARRCIEHIAEYIDGIGEQHKDVYINELKEIDDLLVKVQNIAE